ncbi:DUF5977 domain-containing protein, partial [Candidatus Symbiothrix dinenymphae]|uniref:DUF5977 domain-containing protein n=1 Tax=Candidatus Symbiothrix dinenymphae TaxID=467085 RepID=UPI000A62993B
MKKIFLLTLLALFAGSTAVAQTPTFGGGSGTSADPYLITSKADWDAVAAQVNNGWNNYQDKYFVLTEDLTGITTIIGTNAGSPFMGKFDGWGHEVNVNITASYAFNGVFGRISNSTIKNLGVTGTFTRNNCDPEYIGSQVTYIVAAGNHTSTISQADADS